MPEHLPPGLEDALRRYITDDAEWEAVRRGTPLLEAGGLDSLSVVNLVAELEILFDIRFTPDTLDDALADLPALAAFVGAGRDT